MIESRKNCVVFRCTFVRATFAIKILFEKDQKSKRWIFYGYTTRK